jgi:hypothetical protein
LYEIIIRLHCKNSVVYFGILCCTILKSLLIVSGVDIVLGIMVWKTYKTQRWYNIFWKYYKLKWDYLQPLVRELLLRNTKVILCANNAPSLNDVTKDELIDIVEDCCNECDVIRAAFKESNQLLIYGNGQNGPCLDFRTLSSGK